MQRLTWTMSRVLPGGSVILDRQEGRLQVDLDDGYWSPLLHPAFVYEPEVDRLLRHALRPGTKFLDCGANMGYWSLIASSLLGPGETVAVEAAPETFAKLARNAEINDRSFIPLHRALWSAPGETVQIVSHHQRHAGSSVVDRSDRIGQDGYTVADVVTTTVDQLVNEYVTDDTELVIKLDVEGAELPALDGAAETLRSRDALIVYEDHGKDVDCTVTAALMERGMRCYRLDRPSVITLAEARSMKTDPAKGYNFAACQPGSRFTSALVGT